MAKQDINIGTNPNDGTGDSPRASASKINANFTEVYAAIPAPSAIVPIIDGTAAIGSSTAYARANHVHPTDTSRAATSHTHAATDIVSGLVAPARLGSGTANSTTYLRGDNTWATISGGGAAASLDVIYYPQSYGAIGDNNSHALSTITTLNGTNTTGWTLAQWQAVFPHALALSDEIDWCAIQAAVNVATSKTEGGLVVVPNTGNRYKLNRGLIINPRLVSVRGNGAVLDFTQVTTNGSKCISFVQSSGPDYGHAKNAFNGFEIRGPGRGNAGVVGIYYGTGTASEGRSSRAVLRDVVMHQFDIGLQLGNNAYCIHHDRVDIFECNLIFQCYWDLQNTGEQITFTNCTMFNSTACFDNRGRAHISCSHCSFDYMGSVINSNAGIIDLLGCRVEMSPPAQTMFTCWGDGRINIMGGFYLVNGPESSTTAPNVFYMDDAAGSAHIWSLTTYNTTTPSGVFAAGPGKVYLYDQKTIITNSVAELP